MRCILICVLSCLLFKPVLSQQSKASFLGVYGDVSIPVGDFGDLYRMGYGGELKYLKHLTERNAITFTAGVMFSTIKMRYTTDDETQTYRIIPLTAGYRHYMHDFFVEGSAGVGTYQMRHEYKDVKTISWHTSFTSAIRVGYVKDQYEMAARYQTGLKKDDNVSMIVLSAGYHFRLSRKGS